MTLIPYFTNMFSSYYILFYLLIIGLVYFTKDKWITALATIVNIVIFLDMVSNHAGVLDYVLFTVFLIINLKVLFDILEGRK